jgi:hypothetical protein
MRARNEEIWQIIEHLRNQGLDISQYQVEENTLIITIKIPLIVFPQK